MFEIFCLSNPLLKNIFLILPIFFSNQKVQVIEVKTIPIEEVKNDQCRKTVIFNSEHRKEYRKHGKKINENVNGFKK